MVILAPISSSVVDDEGIHGAMSSQPENLTEAEGSTPSAFLLRGSTAAQRGRDSHPPPRKETKRLQRNSLMIFPPVSCAARLVHPQGAHATLEPGLRGGSLAREGTWIRKLARHELRT